MSLAVCIYAGSPAEYFKNKIHEIKVSAKYDIYHVDSSQFTRLDQVKKLSHRWILFLDADCELEPQQLLSCIEFIQSIKAKNHTIYGGEYKNPSQASYLQRAHNFIANAWFQLSFLSNRQPYFLGGAFLLYSDPEKIELIPSLRQFWGAEDKLLAHELVLKGYQIETRWELNVIHHTSTQWRHFIRRAWLHGRNDSLNRLQDKSHSAEMSKARSQRSARVNYLFSRFGLTEFVLVPAILLHFLFLLLGKLSRKILPVNNSLR